MPDQTQTIPVFAGIGKAFGTVFSSAVLMSMFTLSCVALLLLARVAIMSGIGYMGWEGRPWIDFASRLPLVLVLTPFAVGLQRHVVLGIDLPRSPLQGFFSETNLRFAMIAAAFGLPFYFLQNVPLLFPVDYTSPWFWLVNLAPLATILVAVASVRLYIKLPLIAVREELPFVMCWQATRGNHWQLFVSNVAMGGILAVIGWTMTLAYGNLKPGFSWGRLIVDGVVSTLWALYVALAVALIAHWLVFFIEQKRIPQPAGTVGEKNEDETEDDADDMSHDDIDGETEATPPPKVKSKRQPAQFRGLKP